MGLSVIFFFIYIMCLFIATLILLSNMDLTTFLITLSLLGFVYLAFFVLGRVNIIRLFFSDKLPDIVVNDNF